MSAAAGLDPADSLGWPLATLSPVAATASYSAGAGVMVATLATAQASATVTTLGTLVTGAGASASGVNGMVLCDWQGDLIAATGSMTTALSSTGYAEGTLVSERAVKIVQGQAYFLVTSLEELAGQVHRQALDTAVRQVAPELGVRPDELLDSRSFLDTARQLDPGSAAFTAGIREAAKAAAAREPGRFLAAPPAPPAPPGPAEASAGDGQWSMDDFNRATNAEVLEAINAGKLRALGVGPPRHHRY